MAEMGERLSTQARREVRHKLATGLKTPRMGQKVTAD